MKENIKEENAMHTGEKGSDSQFNINLSILRIVACFMVVSIHTGINAGWTQYVEAGQYGVQLFFVLSGFLIFQSLSSGISVGAFYKKRVMRIVPEYWTALVLYWFVGVIESVFVSGWGGIVEAVGAYNAPYGIRYLRYFTFTNLFLPSDDWYLWNNRNAWWTMSSFMFFYLLAPLLHKFINNFVKSAAVLTIMLGFTPLFRSALEQFLNNFYQSEASQIGWFCENTPIAELYCFLFGVTVYYAIKEKREFIYIIYLLMILYVFNMGAYNWEIIMTLCLMGSLQNPIPIKGSLEKIIKFLAEGSFAVYCIHGKITGWFGSLFAGVSTHGSVRFILIFGCTCIVCYSYYILYRFLYEKVKRRFVCGTE